MPPTTPPRRTPLYLFVRFLGFGVRAWGGPVAQIAMISDELVDEERWIDRERFNRTLAVYQALPGPEAHELCVYFGMITGGRLGGLAAGLGFMLPGFVLVLVVAAVYVRIGATSPIVAAILLGMQPAIAALIVWAVVRIGRHALGHPWLVVVAISAAGAHAAGAPFWIPLLFGGAVYAAATRGSVGALIGLATAFVAAMFVFGDPSGEASRVVTHAAGDAPGLLALAALGAKAGLLTFGGAYTALPFVRQDAVVQGRWLTDAAFLDSVALSGVLPAPLIIFGTFVGYVGAGLDGALIVTAAIFAPAFAFTLAGHRHLERLVNEPRTHAFLDGVTAAVVGLIAVTAVRLIPAAIDGADQAFIALAALVAIVRWRTRWATPAIMLGAGMAGLIVDVVSLG